MSPLSQRAEVSDVDLSAFRLFSIAENISGREHRFLLVGPLDNTGRKLLQTGVRDAPNQPNLP